MGRELAVPEVWEATRGLLVAAGAAANTAFSGASIDSRTTRRGDLFFAIPGERQDGHDFIRAALAAGASGAFVERPVERADRATVFQVSSTLVALQRLAAHWRGTHDIPIVAITGSVGKTTCKELVAVVLGSRWKVLKSEANLNTEIGIPLTLLRLRSEHERAVLEFGMYARGDIALLARIARPRTGVVTNIGPVHLERLGSMGAIASAKGELVEALPAEGTAILNGDDWRTASLAQRTGARVLLYGQSEQCHVRASGLQSAGLAGFSFKLSFEEQSAEVSCPLPGKHHVYPALAAAAVAISEGMALSEIAGALREARPNLRLRILPGPNGSTIIDDSYNASPASMLAVLDLLAELPGRRLALLGDMRELGTAQEEGHRSVGQRAATACDLLLTTGERITPLAEAARDAGGGAVHQFESPDEALRFLKRELKAGDTVLIKASRAAGMESVVEGLTTG